MFVCLFVRLSFVAFGQSFFDFFILGCFYLAILRQAGVRHRSSLSILYWSVPMAVHIFSFPLSLIFINVMIESLIFFTIFIKFKFSIFVLYLIMYIANFFLSCWFSLTRCPARFIPSPFIL